ncbi:MAG TPA: transposase, partial [Acidobacteriota bacterium]|nr:transposase [Acidobacteriota bacterium]
EKYLDAARGACPLRKVDAAKTILTELESPTTSMAVAVPHYTIMPNHWHALLIPAANCELPLAEIMRRLKGRTARAINAAHGTSGPLWQREWFDRWIRDDTEWERCVAYIRNNPVKAGLVTEWPQHPWTK